MSGIRTRSQSLGTAAPKRPQVANPVARVVGRGKNIPPNIDLQNMAFLAIPDRNNIPEAPGAGEIPALIAVEDAIESEGTPEAVQENSQLFSQDGVLQENLDEDNSNVLKPNNVPHSPPSARNNLRMYSDEDTMAIVRAAMMDVIDPSSDKRHNGETQFTGSAPTIATLQSLRDTQSIIEIDIQDSIEHIVQETRRVPVKEYIATTTHQSSMASKVNFTNDGSNNRSKLKELELILNDCELYSLAEGKRNPLPSTSSNPDGYTQESAKFDGTKIVITKKDDYYRWSTDESRLFAIMNLATNKDLHYLLTSTIKDKNAVEWYVIIEIFALGERSNESGLSRKLLDELKLPASKTVKENIAAFEEAVLRVDNVNLTSMTDSEKLFLLYAKMKENKQDGMQAIVYTARGSDKTYREFIEMLIKADPPTVKAFKMNAIVEDKELCRGFIKGNCKFGTKCKFSHVVSKTPGSLPQERQAYTKQKATAPNKYKPPDNKAVSFEQRSKVIGAPRGKPTAKNPEGYSLKQLSMIKEDLKSESVDNWQDPAYFQGSSQQHSNVHMNMLRVQADCKTKPSNTPQLKVVQTPDGMSRSEVDKIDARVGYKIQDQDTRPTCVYMYVTITRTDIF